MHSIGSGEVAAIRIPNSHSSREEAARSHGLGPLLSADFHTTRTVARQKKSRKKNKGN